jgi:hypothetical protein
MQLTRRQRRRLLWIGVPLLIASGVFGIIEVVPAGKPLPRYGPSGPPKVPPSSVAIVAPKQVRVSATDRAAINALMDKFVPDAIERKDSLAAYALATPTLQHEATKAQWRNGSIPGVGEFDAKHVGFHAWSVNFSFRDEVSFDLQLEPRNPRTAGPTSFRIDVKRLHGRWLVDSIYTVRVLPPETSPGGQQAKHPVTKSKPPKATPPPPNPLKSQISQRWWIVIGIAIGLVLLLPILIFAGNAWRNNRAARRYARKLD